MPGDDVFEASRVVAGELPDLPHLVEAPGRGPGADMLGRTAAALPDVHVDLQPSGWRVAARRGLDEQRAAGYLAQDVDALEGLLAGHDGVVKTQLAGPWTLAAGLELPRGERLLADHGARRDVAAALAEAAAAHVAELRRRLPHATVLLQLDEPSLPAVLGGRIPTASGFRSLRSIDPAEVRGAIRAVVDAVGGAVGVHCCAADVPWQLLREAGVAFLSVDASLLGTRGVDAVGEYVESGGLLALGVAATAGPPSTVAAPARALWHQLSFPAETLADVVLLTPPCGLAGATPDVARATLSRVREAARSLDEAPEA